MRHLIICVYINFHFGANFTIVISSVASFENQHAINGRIVHVYNERKGWRGMGTMKIALCRDIEWSVFNKQITCVRETWENTATSYLLFNFYVHCRHQKLRIV